MKKEKALPLNGKTDVVEVRSLFARTVIGLHRVREGQAKSNP
jgi:hypothetical protein